MEVTLLHFDFNLAKVSTLEPDFLLECQFCENLSHRHHQSDQLFQAHFRPRLRVAQLRAFAMKACVQAMLHTLRDFRVVNPSQLIVYLQESSGPETIYYSIFGRMF